VSIARNIIRDEYNLWPNDLLFFVYALDRKNQNNNSQKPKERDTLAISRIDLTEKMIDDGFIQGAIMLFNLEEKTRAIH